MTAHDVTTHDRIAALSAAAAALPRDFGFTPVLAVELEWYVRPVPQLSSAAGVDLCRAWDAALHTACIPAFPCHAERGPGQFETSLWHGTDAAAIAADATRLREVIAASAAAAGYAADFAAKPFPDQPGSGLHVHISLRDAAGHNVFTRRDGHLSAPLRHALGGLLVCMAADQHVFAPTEASLRRCVPGWDAPTRPCWGYNNRTVALRLPDTPWNDARIEHRVAGADASPAQVLTAVLHALHHGLHHALDPGPPVYGNAGQSSE